MLRAWSGMPTKKLEKPETSLGVVGAAECDGTWELWVEKRESTRVKLTYCEITGRETIFIAKYRVLPLIEISLVSTKGLFVS